MYNEFKVHCSNSLHLISKISLVIIEKKTKIVVKYVDSWGNLICPKKGCNLTSYFSEMQGYTIQCQMNSLNLFFCLQHKISVELFVLLNLSIVKRLKYGKKILKLLL